MLVENRLKEMNIELPEIGEPKAMYIPARKVGNLLYISGQIPMIDGKILYQGKVGKEKTLEEGQEAARICAINILAVLKEYLGDLDKINCIVKVQAFVSSEIGFDKQHIVVNAASELLYEVLGEKGRHTRTAISVNQLPLDATVEIEAIIEVKE